jgi:hypothetical protein
MYLEHLPLRKKWRRTAASEVILTVFHEANGRMQHAQGRWVVAAAKGHHGCCMKPLEMELRMKPLEMELRMKPLEMELRMSCPSFWEVL